MNSTLCRSLAPLPIFAACLPISAAERATGCEVAPGKILLTSEGDVIHFRNIRLTPLN